MQPAQKVQLQEIWDAVPASQPRGVSFNQDVRELAHEACTDFIESPNCEDRDACEWWDSMTPDEQHRVHMIIVDEWVNWPDEDEREHVHSKIVRLRKQLGYDARDMVG